jgi:hypothetical protein
MRRINSTYWISLAIWFVLSFGFMLVNRFFSLLKSDDLNILLGIIAVAVSIISLGLATIKKPLFNGVVYCWNVDGKKQHVNNENITPIGVYSCLTFKIDNKSNEPIKDLVINFRFPSTMAHMRFPKDDFYSYYEFKDTLLLTARNISFLGSNSGDSDIILEHLLNLDKWNMNRKMYITISGSNITPTTKSLNFNMIDKLINSSSSHPLVLK